MALYVIGDTHFSPDGSKSMDYFGGKWLNYRQKLVESLSALKSEDTLVLCGDFSWGMSLDETLDDFRLLDSFGGRKILVKGNHDYWWETVNKMNRFFAANDIRSICFLHNNFFEYEKKLLCGTRGWMYDKNDPATHDVKIFKRELIRLEVSLSEAVKAHPDYEPVVFLHYPPIFYGEEEAVMHMMLRKYGVKRCFYGHLHSDSIKYALNGLKSSICYKIVSADAVDFKPVKIE